MTMLPAASAFQRAAVDSASHSGDVTSHAPNAKFSQLIQLAHNPEVIRASVSSTISAPTRTGLHTASAAL